MATRFPLIAAILAFAVLSLDFQCDKEVPPSPDYVNTFAEPVGLSPYKLDYKVGDTIWLTVNIPGKRLFDEKKNERVFVDSLSFNSFARVELLYNNPFVTTGPFASFIIPPGVSANSGNGGGTFLSITYGCSSVTDYKLLLGIVLIEKGVFGISFFNSSIFKCKRTSYAAYKLTFSFDVTDTHKAYYQQLPFSSVGLTAEPSIVDRLEKKYMVAVHVQ